MKTEELVLFIAGIAEEFRALDIKVLHVSEVCSFADYFMIMSGTSSVHIQSIAEEVIYKCKHAGQPALSIEGLTKGEWCLLDFGSVVVHIFHPQKRTFYDLESLWADAGVVDYRSMSTPV